MADSHNVAAGPTSGITGRTRLTVYLVFTISGVVALVYQVIWARWLSLIFGYTTASVAVVLTCFMAGLALGSWIGGRALQKISRPLRAYAWVEVGIRLFAILFPILTRGAVRSSATAAIVRLEPSSVRSRRAHQNPSDR